MRALLSSLRKQLETSVLAARRAAEAASRAAIEGLGVFADRRPDTSTPIRRRSAMGFARSGASLGDDREPARRGVRVRAVAPAAVRAVPGRERPAAAPAVQRAGNARRVRGARGRARRARRWSVAARFAAEILPGIFRLDDPCVRLRLAPEGRHALEQILDALPAETFAADDALGWVYQFWQKDKKDEVNASERKIGGADLGPVTQLFTENYMVRFLLENSLGAWWAARHPDSPLVKGFDYLRFDDDGKPAAGVVRRLAGPCRRGHGHGPVLRVGSLPRRGVLDALADARRGGRTRTRRRARRGAARQPLRPRARPPLRADRHVRRCAASVEGRRRLASAPRAEHRVLRHPSEGARRGVEGARQTATSDSRTRSSACTSFFATQTRLGSLIDPTSALGDR